MRLGGDALPRPTAGAANTPLTLKDFAVGRQTGTPDPSVVGIQIQDAYAVTIDNVSSYNAGICWQFKAGVADLHYGIVANLNKMFAGKCSDAYLDLDTWPEFRVNGGRFGVVGSSDVAANTYIRIEGKGLFGTSGGPNEVNFVNFQFNAGTVAQHFIEFKNLAAGNVDTGFWNFSGDHIEGVGSCYLYSDATWPVISRLHFTNMEFNSIQELDCLDPATQISSWHLANSFFAGTATFKPSTAHPIDSLLMTTNEFVGKVTLVGWPTSGGGTVATSTNMYRVGLEINGSWGQAVIGPDILATGLATFTNTATGKVSYNINSVTGGYGQNTPLIDNTVVYRASTGNGFTYSFPDQVMSLVLYPTATIATGTVVLPPNPLDDQRVRISTVNQITALAITPAVGQTNICTPATVTLTPSVPISCIYHTSTATWYPN